MARALPADAGPSVAADFAIRRCAPFLALPWADVTLEFAFVAMPTSLAVTVSTVTLSVASTHLSGLLVYALAVVALAELPADEASAIGVTAHAAATVTGTCVRADHTLRVSAELFALPLGEGALFLVLAGVPKPGVLTGAFPTVAGAVTAAGLRAMCGADPVVAFAPRAVVLPRLGDGTEADPAVAFPRPAADEPVRGPAPALRKLPGELAGPATRPQRLRQTFFRSREENQKQGDQDGVHRSFRVHV